MDDQIEFRIESESPANSDLMFWGIVGVEAFSRPSVYELRVLSKNDAIDPKKILGHAFDVAVGFQDPDGGKHERHAKGHAVRFAREGSVGRYFEYRITLRSWFWLLTKRVNSRIFQDKTVLQVIDAVLEDTPLARFKKIKTDHVIGAHPPRRYCVQHQETDFDFLSRLMEDEGIYYWFDAHDAPGTMHLSDASTVAHGKLPVVGTLHGSVDGATEWRYNEIQNFKTLHKTESGKYASRDSDFKAIKKKLVADKSDPDTHELADLEVFEFPGGYFSGDDTGDRARIRMEELAARRDRFTATTSWPDVAVGKSFHYEKDGHGLPDADYLIKGCALYALHPGYEGIPVHDVEVEELSDLLAAMLEDDPLFFDSGMSGHVVVNRMRKTRRGQSDLLMELLPADQPYRPARQTPRVVMTGPQSAKVVGPDGEEIHADKHGRVKVHFHWDRYDKENENSTCWVRVSQPWAGKGWGGYFIPRIGQEVIVDFLNGDPDRPIIVGRVYNDDQPIPFDSHTQSGFRTRSTPKGGVANFNEFRFDDKKGSEQVFLHAEKNLDSEVEADETRDVGHDRTTKIHNNETLEVDADRKTHVKGHFSETVDGGEDRTVHAGFDEKIDGGETRKVDGGMTETINGGMTQTINGGETRTVNGGLTESISGGETRVVNGGLTETVNGSLTQTMTGATNITSAGPMTITAPAGFTVIAPGGNKFIDQFFEKTGATYSYKYGVVFGVVGIKTEQGACSQGNYATKFDFSMCRVEHRALFLQSKGTDMKTGGISLKTLGPDIKAAAISMFV